MKYVIIRNYHPVVFSEALVHADMVKIGHPTSAGFVEIVDGKVNIYGKSISLKLEPDKKMDQILLERLFGIKE